MQNPIASRLRESAALIDDELTREAVARDLQDVYLRDIRAARYSAAQDELRRAYMNTGWLAFCAFVVGLWVGWSL